MRADRLLKLMMLLQGRGRKTGRELAHELEVSIRTLYRDLRALEAAGVPLVTENGPGGGVSLMDDFRSDLTGLTEREAEALFAAGTSGALAALGMDRYLKAALAKLAAGSPSRLKGREEKARRRILLDVDAAEAQGTATRRDATKEPLAALRDAVMAGRRVRLTQRISIGPVRGARIERTLEPYGLVWSRGLWYAVGRADGRVRAVRISDLERAEATTEGSDDGRFDIPDTFDLGEFWKCERAYFAAFATSYPVTLRLRPDAVPWLGEPYASRAAGSLGKNEGGTADGGIAAAGTEAIELRFSSAEEARSRLAALGGAVEILAPVELRTSLADLGGALIRSHGR